MHPDLHTWIARNRRRALERATAAQPELAVATETPAVTIRAAAVGDVAALERLAALEDRALPAGPLLVAEVDGEVEAALPVAGGDALANPFARADEVVPLLRVRARSLAA